MTAEKTTIAAFNRVMKRRGLSVISANWLILHSNRVSQYNCNEFIKLLGKYKIVRSNSRKGNCWDNAVAESFFKTLTVELIYRIGVKTVEETRNKVFAYIETWYNKKYRHKSLNNINIDEFWEKYYKKININNAA